MSVCLDAVEDPEWLNTGIYDDVETYDGTLYCQRLTSRNVTDMRCSPRMMPVLCGVNPLSVAMHRWQIAEKVGKPCDPDHEHWLGCEAAPTR